MKASKNITDWLIEITPNNLIFFLNQSKPNEEVIQLYMINSNKIF